MLARLSRIWHKLRPIGCLFGHFVSRNAGLAAHSNDGKKAQPDAEQQELLKIERVNTHRHARYPQSIDHYARQYRRSVRALKRWSRIGKEKSGTLPPLENPSLMPAWWRKHMPYRDVPADILALANASEGFPKQSHFDKSATLDL
jgi:hypothetical protein